MKVRYAILMLNHRETGSLNALICLRKTEMLIETNPSVVLKLQKLEQYLSQNVSHMIILKL